MVFLFIKIDLGDPIYDFTNLNEDQYNELLVKIASFLIDGFSIKKYGSSFIKNVDLRTFYFEPDLSEFYYCN